MAGGPANVDVLLVDDDAEWVRTTGAALEATDVPISAITATGGWEALDLLEAEDFDCIVCDYRMPDFDGIALLERIRSEYGDVPFILITGSGSEIVASRAISSRVTDYFIKDPTRDQAQSLAMRIRTAVEAHRNREALAAERRRFAELFEGVPDPIAIVDDGRLVDTNDAFDGLFGGGHERVEASPIAPVVADAGAGDNQGAHLVELETRDGERDFLVRQFPLGRPGAREVGYVLTDVTLQRDRQRELERFHELAAEVRELLVSAGSREELAGSFCETVVAGIEDARAILVGGGTDDPTVRAAAGGVEESLRDALVDPDASHPVSRALETREAQYVADVASMDAAWARRAREADVRELLALPVERNGLPVGAFVACVSGSSLDETTRDRLAGLVSSLGDAMGLLDRATALAADRVVRVRLSVADDGALLNRLSSASGAAIEVASAIPRDDDRTALYLDVAPADVEAASAWLGGAGDVLGHEVVDGSRLRLETTARTVPGFLGQSGVAVDSLGVDGGEMAASVDVPMSADVRSVVARIEDAYEAVTVDSIRTVERPGEDPTASRPLGDLTEKQRRVLETAYHEGYFEQPRAQSADDVAAALGISRSTFLQHLRTAERKLLADLLAWQDEPRH